MRLLRIEAEESAYRGSLICFCLDRNPVPDGEAVGVEVGGLTQVPLDVGGLAWW